MFYIYPIDKSCQSCYSFPCQQGLYPPRHSQAGGKSYLWPVTRSPRRSRVSPFEGLGLRFRQEESESRTFKIGGVFILWMVAKSCTTKRMVETRWNPINSGINHLSTGAGFLPSTVVCVFFFNRKYPATSGSFQIPCCLPAVSRVCAWLHAGPKMFSASVGLSGGSSTLSVKFGFAQE